MPKLRLEALEQRLGAATLDNAALKQQLRAAESALKLQGTHEENTSEAGLVRAAQERFLRKVEAKEEPGSAEEVSAVAKRKPRELQRLATAGTNKGTRFMAKELVYPCEFKNIKGLYLFQSLLLTEPGLLDAIREDVGDVPDLVNGKHSRYVCTNAQNNMTQLRVFFSPPNMRLDEQCCAEAAADMHAVREHRVP